MKNDIVVYTAIFNNYDTLKKIKNHKNCDFVCFTDDSNLKSKFYDVRVVEKIHNDPTRNARMYKILPHRFLPEYKYSIWLDASMLTKKGFNPQVMIKENLQDVSLSTFKHPSRTCLYDEFDACIKLRLDDIGLMETQRNKYLSEKHPHNNGLLWSGCLLRKHNEKEIIDFDEAWWNELSNYSKRDQLSFNYIACKNKLHFKMLDINMYDNKYFFYVGHKDIGRKRDAFIKYVETMLKKYTDIDLSQITKK